MKLLQHRFNGRHNGVEVFEFILNIYVAYYALLVDYKTALQANFGTFYILGAEMSILQWENPGAEAV